MSADTPPAPRKVYQLKVVLRQCSPLIWRRLLVTSDTTIAQLHTILQIAMGWEDVHFIMIPTNATVKRRNLK